MSSKTVTIHRARAETRKEPIAVVVPDGDAARFGDVAFLTAMTSVLLGNYSQTGHFGGPLAYTTMNVAVHLAGPERGGLRYDLREPKHPFSDRFMLSGGHGIPTCYSLWMILYESLSRRREAGGGEECEFDPSVAVLPIDALGFRRGRGALATLLEDQGLADDPLFSQAKLRGIRALSGHSESSDVTNDVNGGPSGIGVSTAVGKALFWDLVGAPPELKVMALEGEFAMTEGHAQEMKTAALAHRVGKRLRILLSMNNAGIDDRLVGGVISESHAADYDLRSQWASYGWNVLTIRDGNDVTEVLAAMRAMEDWPEDDRRPLITVAPTLKGWWPAAEGGEIPGFGPQLTGFGSHPYALPMNGPYFLALAESFEREFGVEFAGIRDGVPESEADRLVEFKTNVDTALSVLESRDGLGDWIADRVLEIAGTLDRKLRVDFDLDRNPFLDERLTVDALPQAPVEVTGRNRVTGETATRTVRLFAEPGEVLGARRAISEIGKWLNHVTEGRFLTIAADLSDSVNVEACHFFGHYDPVGNRAGTRLKAPIQEAANAATIIGAVGQSVSADPALHAGLWGLSGTYGAFTPLMYTPARVFSQQNQDSPFDLGVLTVLAAHSGPETAADARTHFGIFAPQVFTLFPRGQVQNLYFWDYNDVAPGYFAAAAHAARVKEAGILVIHVARPDATVADRATFADTDLRAAAKGVYLIRDFDPDTPGAGTVWVQGASSTENLLAVLPEIEEEGINVRIAAVISEDLFRLQPEEYRSRILPDRARFDSMVVSTMTKRVPPIANLGPLTEEYSLYGDTEDRWLTGGTEADVIAEAGLDAGSILSAVRRFAGSREERIARQRTALG